MMGLGQCQARAFPSQGWDRGKDRAGVEKGEGQGWGLLSSARGFGEALFLSRIRAKGGVGWDSHP